MLSNNIQIIILAAGEGKRMKSDVPKVLHILQEKAFIEHVVDNAIASRLTDKPIVVVSARHTKVQDVLLDKAIYVVQHEQLGTGHAVAVAESAAKEAEHIIVLYGDMPLLKAESIQKLAEHHIQSGAVLTLLTATAPDFESWRSAFNAFGRIVRDEHGAITKIVDARDATPAELGIKEVSTCFFCFKADWLSEHLKKLNRNNAQREYYLTDLMKMAIDEGAKVESLPVDLREAVGINSKEDLENIKEFN